MSFHYVAFLPSRDGFSTAILKNSGRGESLLRSCSDNIFAFISEPWHQFSDLWHSGIGNFGFQTQHWPIFLLWKEPVWQ